MTEQPSQTDKARDPPQPTTPQKKRSDVEIKNGKVVFRQKPMSFEKMTETMQEMVSFREWLESRTQHQESPLAQIPENYWPLVAKFTQESDKTITALSKHVQQELAPDDEDDINCSTSILPLSVIEDVVKLLASRVNYGIESSLTKTPAALCVWRWELKQEYLGYLPKVSREKVDARRIDRLQYKKDLQAIFEALSDVEKNTLLGVKGHSTSPSKVQPLTCVSSNEATAAVVDTPSDQLAEKTTNHGGDENRTTPKVGRPKAAVDPAKAVEKAAKEKERTDKKAAKIERERKDKEAQEKARSMMASFFGKPKPSTTSASSSKVPAPSASTTLSEFDRVFKPFSLKKGVELAPVNWFQETKRRKRFADVDVIVIDDDGAASEDRDIEMIECEPSPDANIRQYLRHVLSKCPSMPTGVCSSDTIRSLMAQLSEAEVSDDTASVRALLSKLQDRTRIPAKVLIFHEDERPGYFGTFTKRSRFIKPRRPLAQDHIALDYSYDSGAEWGEEEEGGGDDVLGDSDDERDDEEESDDLDGWLVDGDDEEVVTPIEEREGLDAFPFPPLAEGSKIKRKAGKEKETDKEGTAKKRKVVVPLVPFIKGPCWETTIGDCEYDPFNNYRVQLFNDTPYPIDPFTFVSAPVGVRNAPGPSAASSSGTKQQPQFIMPALPPHVLNPNVPSSETAASNSASGQLPQAKRPRMAPKNPFPDDHLPFLKEKVATMGTSSLIALVEALHLDLKNHRVKKNAIEAKLREICVKDQRHIWSVKPDTELRSLRAAINAKERRQGR